jgi:hypothetical protein
MSPAEELRAAATKLRSGDHFIGTEIRCYDRDYLAWLGSLVAGVKPLAEWLEAEAQRWGNDVTRDSPEGPCCDGSMPCHHPEMDFHDGGRQGWGCDGIYGHTDPEERCACWDNALAVARAINGGES